MKIEQISVMTALKYLSSFEGKNWQHSFKRRSSKETSILGQSITTVTTERLKKENRKDSSFSFLVENTSIEEYFKFACYLLHQHRET